MPNGYVCYDPPAYAPPVSPLPALDRGHVTFGCFNNPAKITSQAVEVWARILRRLPGARLVLKFKGWNDSGVARRFTEMFAAHGIDPGRLVLLGPSPHPPLLAEYNRIDMALDPFPYSGGLTTCEALWMGVPVVTCPGETFASRHSLSHLSNVGLTETISDDLDNYVEMAVSLAGDLPRLAGIRAGLRERMARSPLCDGKRFAENLMGILRTVWREHCAADLAAPSTNVGLVPLGSLPQVCPDSITSFSCDTLLPATAEALAHAKSLHRAGRLQAAEPIYRQILEADPAHAEAYYLLGALCQGVGKHDEAVANLRQAARLKPEHAESHNHLGIALTGIGKQEEAIASFEQALRARPDFADAQKNLRRALAGRHNEEGLSLAEQGKLDEAVICFRRALELKPDYPQAHGNLGNAFKEQGKLSEAVTCYQRVLEILPDSVEAHNNLGNACKDQGKLDEAVACYRRALEFKPDYAEAYNNLGNALRDQGNLEKAAICYRRALELKSDSADGHKNLGNVLKDLGKLEEAIACYRRALALNPDNAGTHNNLGTALKDQGKLDEAVGCCRRALELKPDFAEAHNNLGTALHNQGKLDEAVAYYRRAVELKLDFADAHNTLGVALNEKGNLDEALDCCRRALELKPGFVEANCNLGLALQNQGNFDEAIACYRRALELKPDYALSHNNLGIALQNQGKLGEAIVCHRRALELKPDYALAHNNLGNALKDQGKLEEAVIGYRRALELKPDFTKAHSNLLYAIQYCANVTPAALAEAHAVYDRQHTAALTSTELAGRLRSGSECGEQHAMYDRRLRLGFVSPDLGRHPVGYFLVRVLENLSHPLSLTAREAMQIETICYSDRIGKDSLTNRIQAAANQWRDVRGMSDERLAEQIRADRIDILFDLAGHTARNRLLVFARKPAPIQITWIGYEGTTGLAAMDYVLADSQTVPDGSEQYYRERVLRMPDGYLCYDPPAAAPTVGPLPSAISGYSTFASFNNPAKITPDVVAVWAKILCRAPTARLVLKYRGLGDETVKRRYRDLFAAHNVAPQRLELLPASSYSDYLATYHQVDVVLDPFPFSGGTTTCEALWMGVPVITCPGRRDLCQPTFAQPPLECRSHRDDCPRL